MELKKYIFKDKTVRFWDLRTRGCVNVITPATNPNSRQGSPVSAICVDPSGNLGRILTLNLI